MDSRDDIVGGVFGCRFVIGELINGDHFVVVREHHNPVK